MPLQCGLGKKMPEEVAIASFSGTVLSTIVNPQLTTVEVPLVQMGKTAAELILEKKKILCRPIDPWCSMQRFSCELLLKTARFRIGGSCSFFI